MAMSVWTVVLAAGSGTRFGGHKQFAMLGHQRLVDWPVATAGQVTDGVVVVLPPDVTWTGAAVAAAVTGGATHPASVAAGLAALPPDADIVVVATAVHPLASADLYRAVIAAVGRGADAAAPAVASADAIKRVAEDLVVASVDKSDLRIVQAPSAFRVTALRSALAAGNGAPEELELIERAGGTVVTVPGEATNIHVATPTDLTVAERLLEI